MLEKNLEALTSIKPTLVRRISWPVDNSHMILRENGKFAYRLHSSEYDLTLSEEKVESYFDELDKNKDIFVFGIGLGELVDFLLVRFPEKHIVAWEKDPWLMRLFLMKKDYSEAISTGNLNLFMGTDLINLIPEINQYFVVFHPLLKEIYHNETGLVPMGVGDKRILINEGGLFVDDVVLTLKESGYTPFYLNLKKISMEEIEYAIIQFMPSIIFSINYQNGLSELCNKFSIKLLCWEIDPSIDLPASLSAKDKKSHIFTYRKKSIDDFVSAGFQNVHYLPLASNVKRRHPEVISEKEIEQYMCRVSFVGSSMFDQSEEYMRSLKNHYEAFCRHHRMSHDESVNPFKKILDIQGRDYSKYIIPELVKINLGDFLQYLKGNMNQFVDPVILLAEKAAFEKRMAYLLQLGRYALKIWGDEGWKRLEGNGIQYMGYAGHKYEINKIYSASLINIDINRLYQPDMVNMRVFDIMACGGFVIAEHSEALNELFKIEYEVATFKTSGELMEKVGYYLSNTEKAREIAFRGMTAVSERHTIKARVKHMLNVNNENV